MLFGAAWSDPATGKTADWGTLLLAWSWQNIFVLCCSAPQFSIILGAGEGNLSLGWRSQEGGLEHMLSEMRMGMADVRPKFVLVGSQGTTCSICSWLPVTQAAMNSVLLSAICPLGQEIPLSGEQNERDKTGGKKRDIFVLPLPGWGMKRAGGIREFSLWCAVKVGVMIPHKSSSNAAESCGDRAWGRWPSLDSSEFPGVCQNVSHVFISLACCRVNRFPSVSSKSLLCLTKKKKFSK